MALPEVYESYFDRYTKLVPEDDLANAFGQQEKSLENFLNSVGEERSMYAYAPGKWTLKEMLQHLIDCERIFCFRALAIARKDPANLPGFEENDYADNSMANARSWESLKAEMRALRSSTKLMFSSFTPEMLSAEGTFNNNKGQTGKLGFIMIGHTYHHISVAKERYLQ